MDIAPSSQRGGPSARRQDRTRGMLAISGGVFRMGARGAYPEEAPVRDVTVEDFWIDATPVTNAAFAAFVAETNYVTLAERPPNPADYPGIQEAFLAPASIVFTPPSAPVSLHDASQWWRMVVGANWRRPLGPDSDTEALGDHPVVHIAFEDACAYAHWAGKALPSEAEWEYAARGGLDGATYAWGEDFEPGGVRMAKTWLGEFPWRNLAPKDLERTSPVRSYPPNGYGLYDMIGNVWEWTADRVEERGARGSRPCCGGRAQIPSDRDGLRVLKGGSHLCAPEYCQRYRPAARWPQPADTTTSHVGFRCVLRAPPGLLADQSRIP